MQFLFSKEYRLTQRDMNTTVITLMLLLIQNLVFIVDALNLTYSRKFHNEGVELKNNCVTTGRIICEEGLVEIGLCCTRASHLSDITVYGLCPYTILTDQVIYHRWQFEGLFHNYYRINFTEPDQTCGALNRKGLLCSECYDGYGPAVYAFANECVKCHGNAFSRWALYLFVVLFPVTACVLYHCDCLQHSSHLTSLCSIRAFLSNFCSI